MPEGLVTYPFIADLGDVERRLEVGERVPVEQLERWGRSVDHLVHTGRLAMVDEVPLASLSDADLLAELARRDLLPQAAEPASAPTESASAPAAKKPAVRKKPAARKKGGSSGK